MSSVCKNKKNRENWINWEVLCKSIINWFDFTTLYEFVGFSIHCLLGKSCIFCVLHGHHYLSLGKRKSQHTHYWTHKRLNRQRIIRQQHIFIWEKIIILFGNVFLDNYMATFFYLRKEKLRLAMINLSKEIIHLYGWGPFVGSSII